ncbi:MAG TPA: metal-dependent hydrolase [Planctomycetota bacterium]|nr:metal-dependent hydrolase [Planctomycetota bacterium]
MPDLLTHWAAAQVPATTLRDRRLQALLVLGTFLPDIGAKGLHHVARAPTYFEDPTHSLAGLLLLCYGACLFLEPGLRKGGFAALYAGAAIHLVLDLAKDNPGDGGMRLLLPFSGVEFELGLVASENVIYLLPFDALVLLACFLVDRRRRALRG